MFGLMRAKKCGMSTDEKHFRRMNYCGTCKTIGSVYGAKTRFLLNHDAVFLAEILTAATREDVGSWHPGYRSFNCLSLPKNSIPRSLQWAAAANVILTEFKIADHITDSEGFGYSLARRAFSKEFNKARRFLEIQGFPMNEVSGLLGSQTLLEAGASSLEELAFPTARVTGIFFREGVRHIGRDDLEIPAFQLGFAFGKLVYLLDAFEDYEKDVNRNRFNAFRKVFQLNERSLSAATRRRIGAILAELEHEIADMIESLPIAEDQRSLFISRLSGNLQRKLKVELPVVRTICSSKPKQKIRERWHTALEKAREFARGHSWQMPIVFIFVLAFALIAPAAQAKEARSARECFDLGFNLIFLGTLFGSVLALPKKLLSQGLDPKEEAIKHAVKGGKSGGSSWCSGCDCDGCTCCCDCGDCCTGCDC